MLWDTSSLSNKGEREKNEDCVVIAETEFGLCCALCDGLGGHDNGEIASTCVCDSIKAGFEIALPEVTEQELVNGLMLEGQSALLQKQQEPDMSQDMKTTACCLVFRENRAAGAYIGDSRIYHFRRKHLLSKTKDHSVPQYLVQIGEIKEKEIRHHPDRNKLLRVMGTEWDKPRYQEFNIPELKKGDTFLLCSDGFWEWISEWEMMACLWLSKSSEDWLNRMSSIVINRGTGNKMDNYSAIAIRIL